MEQRIRILHHTRSKTPVILAPSKSKPRITNQSSKVASGHEKAPLASLDTEVSNLSRRQGSRSSSTGRRVLGSDRIVSRDFLKSDQISDRSGDDDDPASPCRSAPLRRHTMGSITRPRTKSEDACEPESTSRRSCPPEASSSRDKNHLPADTKWNGARQNIPKGPVVKLPTKNPPLDDEIKTNSKHSQLNRTSSKRSDHVESPPNKKTSYNALSQTVITNSDSKQHQTLNNSKVYSPQDLSLPLQERAIPTSLSSQLANRDSINVSSPLTSPVYSFSVSSQRQSNVHPPSSLNVNPSSPPCASDVTSPSNVSSSQHSGLSPQMAMGYNWRTDPRRRPLRSSGEFYLSPEDGSHGIRSPQNPEMNFHHAFIATTTTSPSAGTESSHIYSTMNSYTSTYFEKDDAFNIANNRSDSLHDKQTSSNHNPGQPQGNKSYRYSSKVSVNYGNATSPSGSPTYHNAKQSHSYRKGNNLRHDTLNESVPSSPPLSSHKSLEISHPHHPDIGSHVTIDIRPQPTHKSPPPGQENSLSHYGDTTFIQTESHNNFTLPRYNDKNMTNAPCTNSLNRQNDPISTYKKEWNRHSKTTAQSRYSENIFVDSYFPSGFCRKRDSMRLATEGNGELSYCSQSIDYSDLPGARNTAKDSLSQVEGSGDQKAVEKGHTVGLPCRDERQSSSSEKFPLSDVQKNVEREESQLDCTLPGYFVRGSRQRDSYRLATSSNPDLLNSADQEELFISCEDILASNESGMPGKSSTPVSENVLLSSSTQTLKNAEETKRENITRPSDTNLKKFNDSEIFSKIKRNSLRLATASLSDLSVILDEIDIGEPLDTPTASLEAIEHPSPLLIRNCTKLSPLAERSLERSGSSVSSRNSSSFGSFYSCQSIGHNSAKSSPYHTSSHSSPRSLRPKVSTPDSVHRLMTANAHDSGISQSSEDTNSFNNFANTSIGSYEEMEYNMNQTVVGGSLNRKRPVFYWTRQSPYPRQNHNTIPASWKPKEYSASKSSIHNSPNYPQSGSIRSYGSTSSVESSSSRSKPTKHLPRSSQILQRYGCGLDRKSPKLCTRGSTDSQTRKTTHPKHPPRDGLSSSNHRNFNLPLESRNDYRLNVNFDHHTQTQIPVSPTFVESPTADTPRSPPSLGRPKRKLYAGFDSQPLPMDTFFSDSSSVCTDVSYSSHGTDVSGQPDSGTFDESFYSIDNRSVADEEEGTFEASLTPKDFMNLTEINKNSELRDCRSNSLQSTSTAKEGDAEYSDGDEEAFEETITQYQNHPPHQHMWPGTNYSQSVTSSLPMTFSI